MSRGSWQSLQANTHKSLSMLLILGLLFGMFAPVAPIAPVYAASVTSAVFSGGTGTYLDTSKTPNVLYAKKDAALTLTVKTSSDTQCVDVAGAFTGRQTSSTAKSMWEFKFTAPAGDGAQGVTATASGNFNKQNECTGKSESLQASYILDNTPPVLLPSNTDKKGVFPAPNVAGWNKDNVEITWTAADAGSGVDGQPTPDKDSVTANYSVVDKTATAKDKLGNSGSGSVKVFFY